MEVLPCPLGILAPCLCRPVAAPKAHIRYLRSDFSQLADTSANNTLPHSPCSPKPSPMIVNIRYKYVEATSITSKIKQRTRIIIIFSLILALPLLLPGKLEFNSSISVL